MKTVLETAQKQTLSQRQLQSSEILQMNAADLQVYLRSLATENPLLELDDNDDEQEKKLEWLRDQDEQNRVYERQERKDEEDAWYQKNQTTETLTESLQLQVAGLQLSAIGEKTLNYMIDSLDRNGFLTESNEEIAAALSVSSDYVRECLGLLQSLEPCGIGAHDLRECVLLQLTQTYPHEETAYRVASECLELLGKNQLPQIAKKLHLPVAQVAEAQKLIRTLNPRPGASYGERSFMSYITPDVIVVRFAGYFDILINDSMCRLPAMNTYYLDLLEANVNEETTQYLAARKKDIDWVADCILHRKETLAALSRLIIKRQAAFFQEGPGHLHAFTQSEAARELGVHESTVSRAIRDKYLQCSYGVYPLKYFFVQGNDHKDEICSRIAELISGENKAKPLSDNRISELLAAKGLEVSRRVIAKYRAMLDIPEAAMRKVY